MKNILFIHQSSEMYGSDKTLLLLVTGLKKKGINPIVVLPNEGLLSDFLKKESIKVIIASVLKISRKSLSVKNLFKLSKEVKESIEILDKINHEEKIDIVYSNTLAVLIGVIYAKKRKLKHIWHVHEIIESPKLVAIFFRKALSLNINRKIIFNSEATKCFWNQNNSGLNKKSVVVWNGLSHSDILLSDIEKSEIKEKLLGASENEIIIALVGRISRWKGQKLLLDAFAKLLKKHNNIKLVFVGSSPPNQEVFLKKLTQSIEDFKLLKEVTVLPFQSEISKIWEVVDIAVVPSTEPEPFGLVALEAMLAAKPVIGANHGGLKEIIVDNKTGFLFEPNNVEDLTNCLEKMVVSKDLRIEMGKKGYERAATEFSLEKYICKIEKVCNEL